MHIYNYTDYTQARDKAQSELCQNKEEMRSICLLHGILYRMGTDYQINNTIPESHWPCQCPEFNSRISKECISVYSIGLGTIMRKSNITMFKDNKRNPGGYYADINIDINQHRYSTELYCWKIGEIKKATQPKTRLDRIGTATFPTQSIIRKIAPSCFLQFKLKDEYKGELEHIDENVKYSGYKGF